MIRSCNGPNGEPGVCWERDNGKRDTCHTVPYPDDDQTPEADQARAEAMRAAMRDGANDVGHGDKRFMRDG